VTQGRLVTWCLTLYMNQVSKTLRVILLQNRTCTAIQCGIAVALKAFVTKKSLLILLQKAYKTINLYNITIIQLH